MMLQTFISFINLILIEWSTLTTQHTEKKKNTVAPTQECSGLLEEGGTGVLALARQVSVGRTRFDSCLYQTFGAAMVVFDYLLSTVILVICT